MFEIEGDGDVLKGGCVASEIGEDSAETVVEEVVHWSEEDGVSFRNEDWFGVWDYCVVTPVMVVSIRGQHHMSSFKKNSNLPPLILQDFEV